MNVKYWIGIAGCAVALVGMETIADTARPNVLLIITDDQNTNTVGAYGGEVQTPWIDSLAKNGIKFTNGNVVHSVCSPSRYAMLTGRYYDNNTAKNFLDLYPKGTSSCINNFMELESDGMNLPAVLHVNGYYTGYIGKFHLADTDLLPTTNDWQKNGLQTYPRDVDPRKDATVNAKMKANHEWWRKRVLDSGFDWADAIYPANLREGFNNYLNAHNVEWTADAAVRFVKERQGKKQPFFVCMATTYPHGPGPSAIVNGKYKYSLDADVQLTGEGFVTDRDLSNVLAGETRESCKRLDSTEGLSAEASTAKWWDAAVGAVIQALKETGQYENTLIIYISDHGQLNSGKTTLYETGVHVPLLMQWPERVAGGKVYDHVVGSIDLTPTVLDACGIKKPAEYKMDGISLLPVLNGSRNPVRDKLFMEMGYAYGVKSDHWKYIAVRYPAEIERMLLRGETDPRWKSTQDPETPDRPYLILHTQLGSHAAERNPHYFERNQLYNLKVDSEEKNNIFAVMPEKSMEMKAALGDAVTTHIPHRPFGEFGPLGKPELYSHVSDVVIEELPSKPEESHRSSIGSGDRILVKESWGNLSCPSVLKIGQPFEITFTAHGLDKDLIAGTVLKAVGLPGTAPVVGRFKRIINVENEHLYTLSTIVKDVPEGTKQVQCGLAISPTGMWPDRIYNMATSAITVER